MPYTPNMKASAQRHLEAADQLYKLEIRRDVAGYLYGIATECAVKAMVHDAVGRDVSGHFSSNSEKKDELRTKIRDVITGRLGLNVLSIINKNDFLEHWSIEMRYCCGNEIDRLWIEKWKRQAYSIVRHKRI